MFYHISNPAVTTRVHIFLKEIFIKQQQTQFTRSLQNNVKFTEL